MTGSGGSSTPGAGPCRLGSRTRPSFPAREPGRVAGLRPPAWTQLGARNRKGVPSSCPAPRASPLPDGSPAPLRISPAFLQEARPPVPCSGFRRPPEGFPGAPWALGPGASEPGAGVGCGGHFRNRSRGARGCSDRSVPLRLPLKGTRALDPLPTYFQDIGISQNLGPWALAFVRRGMWCSCPQWADSLQVMGTGNLKYKLLKLDGPFLGSHLRMRKPRGTLLGVLPKPSQPVVTDTGQTLEFPSLSSENTLLA